MFDISQKPTKSWKKTPESEKGFDSQATKSSMTIFQCPIHLPPASGGADRKRSLDERSQEAPNVVFKIGLTSMYPDNTEDDNTSYA